MIFVKGNGNLGNQMCNMKMDYANSTGGDWSSTFYCSECGMKRVGNRRAYYMCKLHRDSPDRLTNICDSCAAQGYGNFYCGVSTPIPCTNTSCENGKVETTVSCGHIGATGSHSLCSAGYRCDGGVHS